MQNIIYIQNTYRHKYLNQFDFFKPAAPEIAPKTLTTSEYHTDQYVH